MRRSSKGEQVVRGFAQALQEFGNGCGDRFIRATLYKASEIITELCDEVAAEADRLDALDNLKEGADKYQIRKEKNEGENEKRDLPPTPPIESKAKEGEEKKGHTLSACAREGSKRAKRLKAFEKWDDDPNETRAEVLQRNKEADEVFEDFWARYPAGSKDDKKLCKLKFRMHYANAKDRAKFINEFLSGFNRWLKSKRWVEGFICAPTVFFNQERWLSTPQPSRLAQDDERDERLEKMNAEAAEAIKRLGV